MLWALLLCGLLAWAAQLRATQNLALAMTIGSVRHPLFEAQGISVRMDVGQHDQADIDVSLLRVAGMEYRNLRLHCRSFYYDGARLDCPQGTLHREDTRGQNRPVLAFSLHWLAQGDFEWVLPETDMVSLSPLILRWRGWKPTGKIAAYLRYQAQQLDMRVAVNDLTFKAPQGKMDAEGLAFLLSAQAQHTGGDWSWHASLDWPQGMIRAAPWVLPSGTRVDAQGRSTSQQITVDQARVVAGDVGALTASLSWDRQKQAMSSWGFVTDPLDLHSAMRDWVQPWLSTLGFPAWKLSGKALFSAQAQGGRLERFYAGLEQARLADPTDTIVLEGVDARIPWSADEDNSADVALSGGRLGDLPLRASQFPFLIGPREALLTGLVVPMLDGRLEIERLRAFWGEAGWKGELSGGIYAVSMPALSRALGWPQMSGELTAVIPSIDIDKDHIALNGAMGIEVFDGGITVHRLRLDNAFSASRVLHAEVTARHLDLGRLTQTFSFGQIDGRFDADIFGLEMRGWTPLAFDARIASVPGGLQKVSIGAIQDIGRLGQDSAWAGWPTTHSRLGGFNYQQITLGCRLRNGICHLSGIKPVDGGGVLLMAGAGLPAINIIGYNPNIDWEALRARVQALLSGKSALTIE